MIGSQWLCSGLNGHMGQKLSLTLANRQRQLSCFFLWHVNAPELLVSLRVFRGLLHNIWSGQVCKQPTAHASAAEGGCVCLASQSGGAPLQWRDGHTTSNSISRLNSMRRVHVASAAAAVLALLAVVASTGAGGSRGQVGSRDADRPCPPHRTLMLLPSPSI